MNYKKPKKIVIINGKKHLAIRERNVIPPKEEPTRATQEYPLPKHTSLFVKILEGTIEQNLEFYFKKIEANYNLFREEASAKLLAGDYEGAKLLVEKSKATKLASGAPKTKTRKFTQGDKARITNTPPKKSKAGPNSPIRGTKVEVTYKTKELTPKQQATLTVGRTSREKTKKAGTYVKGAGTGAYVESQRINRKKKK